MKYFTDFGITAMKNLSKTDLCAVGLCFVCRFAHLAVCLPTFLRYFLLLGWQRKQKQTVDGASAEEEAAAPPASRKASVGAEEDDR